MKTQIFFILALCSLSACQFYHNTTARYNAYFLANEKLVEAEQKLFGKPKDDYTNILQVLVKIDTNQTKSEVKAFDYVLEKASLPIHKHKDSDWVDDCYLIIGKTNLYEGNFGNAATTFKYINTTSTDVNMRHSALIWLMRTFVEIEQYKDAENVAKYLANEPVAISPQNSKDFYLVLGHYYRIRNQYKNAVGYLEKAVPYIDQRQTKTRILFIIGQLHQHLGNNTEAHAAYEQVLRRNADYNMDFHAQLNASKTLDFTDQNSDKAKKIEKYLRNLLTDEKNSEFRDKIYYDLASFEFKRKNYDKSIEYLAESLFYSQGNQAQRSYTYQLYGQVYMVRQEYDRSALYYDSAASLMTAKMDGYEEVKQKAEFLVDFAKSYQLVKESERLLRLSKMNLQDRDLFLEKEIDREKRQIDSLERQAKKRQDQRPAANPNALLANKAEGNKWYFYNTELVNLGKSAFFREWNNRPLEDHWRRSTKQNSGNQAPAPVVKTEEKTEKTDKPRDKYASVRGLEDRMKEIPEKPEKITEVESVLQKNLLVLGKTYFEVLKENAKSQQTLSKLIDRFPKSEQKPEALYILRKICLEEKSKCDPKPYENELREKFAESIFTQLLDGKQVSQKSTTRNSELEQKYGEAYAFYESGKYNEALNLTNELLGRFKDIKHLDKVSFLQVRLMGKTQNRETFKAAIRNFKSSFPQSELLPLADQMLKMAESN